MLTTQDVYAALEKRHAESQPFHRWLGASLVGASCTRFVALSFRCAFDDKLSGRTLRVFANGHAAEDRIVADLLLAGLVVTDRQTEIGMPGTNGHAGVTLDGIGVLGGDEYVLEFKTANAKSFAGTVAKGVATDKPRHYGQMQIGMLLAGKKLALYVVENKDTNELWIESVAFDAAKAEALASLARRIVDGYDGERCSDRPDWYECKMCSARDVCHGDAVPRKHCLTCCHSTASEDKAWKCRIFGDATIPEDVLPCGCDDHLYLPWTVNAQIVGYGEWWIEYELPNGARFVNCPVSSFPKVEVGRAVAPAMRTSEQMAGKPLSSLASTDLPY